MRRIFERAGYRVRCFGDAERFLAAPRPAGRACLIIDEKLPGMSGLELLKKLNVRHYNVPAVMITGRGDVRLAVQAMRAGAQDFIEKPVQEDDLLRPVKAVFAQIAGAATQAEQKAEAVRLLSGLTERQRAVMELVVAGQPSKNIAMDLGISQRTVENHRAAMMRKTGVKSIPALARLAILAAG